MRPKARRIVSAAAVSALATLVVGGCTVHAAASDSTVQSGVSSAPQPAVDLGEVVEVREKDGKTIVGKLVRMDSAQLEVAGDQDSHHISQWHEIARITVIRADRADSLLNGMLVGAGIGATYAGIVVAGQAGTSDSPSRGAAVGAVALGGVIGAGVGAAIDLIWRRPERKVVYRSR
ncbi:MAG TPA: hypothetical protein VF198_12395 [Vicinamibacterales bacterium]